MSVFKSALVKGALVAAMAAGTLAATSVAAAPKYVVCDTYGNCWHVNQKYTDYPADVTIVYHDDAWWGEHQKDAHFHWQADRTDDHGWYDKDGAWHPFGH